VNYATNASDRVAYQNGGLECARLTVPLDYNAPQGNTITLGMLRRPASDPAHRIGTLVVNPGGPGASGMSAAASLASVVASTPLGQRFDLVGFDPRGVGSSQPEVHCLTPPQQDTQRLENISDTSPTTVARDEQQQKQEAAECVHRTGLGLLANVGTRSVARDMDVLRSALGDRKLTYLGYSYGTRLGLQYAEDFPGNVRAMVLDGAVDPTQGVVASEVSQAAGFQKAFNNFAAWCAGQPSCALGTNPNNAVAAYQRLTRPLLQRPASAGGRQLSYSDATTGTIQALYSPQMWPQLNDALGDLAQGDGTGLIQLADSYYGRNANGSYSNTMDVFNAVRCVDDPRVTNPATIVEANRLQNQAAPFMDDGLPPSSAEDLCAYWPVPVTAGPTPPQVSPSLPPTVVVSTTNDPATPYVGGVRLARIMHATLLTFEGTQHTAFLQGNPCVDASVIRYLINLTPPPAGTRCR
jgi:pimeloyl-ACP methyl ester carboxylesterase